MSSNNSSDIASRSIELIQYMFIPMPTPTIMKSESLRLTRTSAFGWEFSKTSCSHTRGPTGVTRKVNSSSRGIPFSYLLMEIGSGRPSGLSRLTWTSTTRKAGHTLTTSMDLSSGLVASLTWSDAVNGSGMLFMQEQLADLDLNNNDIKSIETVLYNLIKAAGWPRTTCRA